MLGPSQHRGNGSCVLWWHPDRSIYHAMLTAIGMSVANMILTLMDAYETRSTA